jgi:hypothetical protein
MLPSAMVHYCRSGDPVQPGGEPEVPPVVRQGPVHPHDRLLYDVIRVVGIPL